MQMTSHSEICRFIYGGKSIFTLRSRKTGERFTYKVKKKHPDLFYVSVLGSGYEFVGTIQKRRFFVASKSGRTLDDIQVRAFKWSLDHLETGKLPSELEFFHEGRCARCTRRLTDPVSIQLGFGKECAGKAFVCN
jgi:hypothetical protein